MSRVEELLRLNKERIDYLRELLKGHIEGNFVICENGEASYVIVGEKDTVKTGNKLNDFCKAMGSEVAIDLHNHPSGIRMPTIVDMVNVAQGSGSKALVCVVTNEKVTCVKPVGEAKIYADKLVGKRKTDPDFYKHYSNYARTLSSYNRRWRSFDTVDKNIEVLEFDI